MDPENSRRDFLKKSIFLLGGLMAVGVAVPGGTYFLSPLWRKGEEGWLELGEISKILPGEPVKVDYAQRRRDGWATIEEKSSAWVVTDDGKKFTVFDPHCTHLGCPYHWDTAKKKFLCPCHNATFGMDGQVISGPPPRPLDQFTTKVVGGKLLIKPRSGGA